MYNDGKIKSQNKVNTIIRILITKDYFLGEYRGGWVQVSCNCKRTKTEIFVKKKQKQYKYKEEWMPYAFL